MRGHREFIFVHGHRFGLTRVHLDPPCSKDRIDGAQRVIHTTLILHRCRNELPAKKQTEESTTPLVNWVEFASLRF